MDKLDPGGINGKPLPPVASEAKNRPTTDKGVHNGQEVTHAEVTLPHANTTPKAEAFQKMPALEQRQVDPQELAMTQLKLAVESPDIVVAPPDAAPEESPLLVDTPEAEMEGSTGDDLPAELASQVAGTLTDTLARAKTIGDDVKKAKKHKKVAKEAFRKASKDVEKIDEDIQKLNADIKSLETKVQTTRFRKDSKANDLAKKRERLQELKQSRQLRQQSLDQAQTAYHQADTDYERLSSEEFRLKEHGASVLEGDQSSKLSRKLAKRLLAASTDHSLEGASGEDIKTFVFKSKESIFSSIISTVAKKAVASTGFLMDSKEVEEAKKLKKAAKKRYEKARDACADTERSIRSLEEKTQNLQQKLDTSGLFKTFRTKKLQKKRTELELKRQTLPSLQKEASDHLRVFEHASESYESVASNGKKLIELLSRFLGGVRDFYAASHPKHGPPRDVRINIPVDHLVIKTPNGLVTLDDVNLSIANIEFVKGPGGRMCPIFKIETLDATAAIEMPDGQVVQTKVAAKGVKVGLAGSVGPMLHKYVTASNAVSAGYGLLKEITHVTEEPSFVTMSAQDIDVTLPEFSPTHVASLIKMSQSSPEPAINALFRTLNFRLSARFENVSVKTEGDLQAGVEFKEVDVDYRPKIPDAENVKAIKPGCTPRRFTVSCGHAEGHIHNALDVVGELKSALTPSSPLEKWIDMTLPLPSPEFSDQMSSPDDPPPPYTEFPDEEATVLSTNDVPEKRAALKVRDLAAFTGTTGFSARKIKVNMTRDIEDTGTREAKLTGYDRIEAGIGRVTVSNEGVLGAAVTAHELDARVHLTDGEPVELIPGKTTKPDELDAHVNVKSVEAHVDAPQSKMLEELLGDETYIRGEVKLTAAQPLQVDCKKSGANLTIEAKVPKLEADVARPFIGTNNGMGVYLPKGHIELGGRASVAMNEHVTTIEPEVTLSSDDSLEILADGQRIPLDLSARVALEKTSPKLFVREDPTTGVKVMTPVISRGVFNFDTLRAGPANIGQVKVVLDGENFGAIHITEVDVALDDITHMLYPPPRKENDPDQDSGGFDLPKIMNNRLVKWAVKRVARNKRLICDAQLKVVDGAVNLNQLDDVQLKFASLSNGRLDRFITWGLNKLTRRYTKKLLRFSLSVEDCKVNSEPSASTQEQSAVDKSTVRRMPVLKIPAPVNGSFPLPIPPDCVNPKDKSISLSSLLLDTTGAVMVSRRDVQEVEKTLKEIDAGSHEAVMHLVSLIQTHCDNPARRGLVHLIARQFPIRVVEKLFSEAPEFQNSVGSELLECANLLLIHPYLSLEAAQFCQLAGEPLNPERVARMIDDSETDARINPAGLGMLVEQLHGDPLLAENCYQRALDRNPSDPLANRCMGILLLKQQSNNFSLAHVTKGYEHLVKAWEAGDKSVRKQLEALETLDQETLDQETLDQETLDQETLDQETLDQETLDQETLDQKTSAPEQKGKEAVDEAITKEPDALEGFGKENLTAEQKTVMARDAKLRLAMIRLAEEKDHKDFDDAMSRLVELAHVTDNPIVQQQAVKLVTQRRDNGTLHPHTSDIKVYNDSQEQLTAARKHLKKLKVKELKPYAKELGMKCLYGSHGVVQNYDMAFQLLLVAAAGNDPEASFHLGMAQAAINPDKQKSYDKLAKAAAAA